MSINSFNSSNDQLVKQANNVEIAEFEEFFFDPTTRRFLKKNASISVNANTPVIQKMPFPSRQGSPIDEDEKRPYCCSFQKALNYTNNMKSFYDLTLKIHASVSIFGGQWVVLSQHRGIASIDDVARKFIELSNEKQFECETTEYKHLVSERICQLYSKQESQRNEKCFITKILFFVRNIFYHYSTMFPVKGCSFDPVLKKRCLSITEYHFRHEFEKIFKRAGCVEKFL